MATKCPGCNANVKPNAKFCTKCGARLTVVETPSGAPREVEASAAADGAAVCANCAAPLKPEAKFCTKCGAQTAFGALFEAKERARDAAEERGRREAKKRAEEQTRRLAEEQARREAAERSLEQERRFQAAKFASSNAASSASGSGGDGLSTRPHSVRDAARRADR